MLVALVSLVLSMGNLSSSAAPGRSANEEVKLLTTVTGQLEAPADWEQRPVTVDNATFTQDAGSTVMLVTNVTANFDPTQGNDCAVAVAWDVPGVGSFPDTNIVALGQWMGRHVFAITPTSADRTLTLNVAASSDGVCDDGAGGVPSYRIGVEVAVLALR
jgi:hypothetical protein